MRQGQRGGCGGIRGLVPFRLMGEQVGFSKISHHWSESNVWLISKFSRPIALLTPLQIFLSKLFCDWLPVSGDNLGSLLTAGVKVLLLEFSQLCRSKLNWDFFTGEHLASGLTSFNMAAWFALFGGFILTNNFGESLFNICFLQASVLTFVGDVIFVLLS